MRRITTTTLGIALVALAALGLTGCNGQPSTSTSVTRSRIERSLEHADANRYVALAKLTGHEGVTASSLDAHAVCDKGGATVADEGPGGDWICQVAYVDPNVPNPDGSSKVEMNVHSNGCYTAASSTKAVGPLNIVDTKGNQVVNPAFEFDACFDPSANGTPDGTMIIVSPSPPPGTQLFDSALTLPVGLVEPDDHGRLPLSLTCAEGGDDCTGTIDVAIQGDPAGSVTYDVPAGATKVVPAHLTKAQARDGGWIILTPHEKTPPPTPKEP
jgi:hypothetical protein